ncbi:sugar nucleotide-binding protein [Nocardia asiatica]|uniref:sugar nucleotide-binding protein n=1 Tax=Nocardia asiatica TaxID=209252 RepID=UPI003CC80D7B
MGSPTSVDHLVEAVEALVGCNPDTGIYHCANQGAVSWYHLARAVFERAGADPDEVRPTSTSVSANAHDDRPTARCRARSGTQLATTNVFRRPRSTGGIRPLAAIVDMLGTLHELIDGVVVSVPVGARKPNPGVFRAALGLADAEPDRPAVAGDNWTADVLGALAEGMSALHIDRHQTQLHICLYPHVLDARWTCAACRP